MIGIDDKYRRVFRKFGHDEQVKKLKEEVYEFNCEIDEYILGSDIDKENIELECADVINVMMQFVIAAGGSAESVISKATEKMIRTEKRIATGYYE